MEKGDLIFFSRNGSTGAKLLIGKAQADLRNASGKAILPLPFFGGEKQDTETKRSFPNIYEVRKTGSQSPAKKAHQECGDVKTVEMA